MSPDGAHGLVIGTAPLRISLAGGGTDLPGYASRKGGVVVGAAIDLGVTVVRRSRPFAAGVRACLEDCQRTENAPAVRNPFAREALRRHWTGGPLEIASFGDVPGGTGMGSSAAFCVALVAVLQDGGDPADLARWAAEIEMAGLGRPVGAQDHYLSALGGFQALRFRRDGRVDVEPIEVSPVTVRDLSDEMLLFSTGTVRYAGEILAGQDLRMRRNDLEVERLLDEIKDLTPAATDALVRGDLTELGRLIGRHWELKQHLSPAVCPPRVRAAYADARAAGATGGKLAGAGGGGHLLLHVPRRDQTTVREAMTAHGYAEREFTFGAPGVRHIRI